MHRGLQDQIFYAVEWVRGSGNPATSKTNLYAMDDVRECYAASDITTWRKRLGMDTLAGEGIGEGPSYNLMVCLLTCAYTLSERTYRTGWIVGTGHKGGHKS